MFHVGPPGTGAPGTTFPPFSSGFQSTSSSAALSLGLVLYGVPASNRVDMTFGLSLSVIVANEANMSFGLVLTATPQQSPLNPGPTFPWFS